MLPSGVLELALSLLGADDTTKAPKPMPQILIDFNALKAPSTAAKPNPAFRAGMTDNEKTNAVMAIENRLLATKEGKSLVNDLVFMKMKHGFTIRFHFDIPYVGPNKKPREAAGFADFLDEHERFKKDINIHVKYEKAADQNEIGFQLEEGADIAKKITRASSRTSLYLFHELMHIWFYLSEFDDVDHPTGHDGSGDVFDERFISRIRKYRNEIAELEAKLNNR